ncbi:MazG-like family protein [Shimia sp. MIT910701]|uniref:MazG-like family protein n=1 Tax=Shimia sp. MIT910701 TaxID=3096987 RepID=UPI00399A95FA
MTMNFETLRAANIARQEEWPGNDKADPAFRALEVADEVGEVMGAVKKWLRAQRDIAGTTLTLEDVADEIGDTYVSLDLFMHALALPPLPGIMPGALDDEIKASDLALEAYVSAGHIVDSFLRYEHSETNNEREARRFDVRDDCLNLIIGIESLASYLGIDTNTAVVAKFNKTSEKYGMATRMETPETGSRQPGERE